MDDGCGISAGSGGGCCCVAALQSARACVWIVLMGCVEVAARMCCASRPCRWEQAASHAMACTKWQAVNPLVSRHIGIEGRFGGCLAGGGMKREALAGGACLARMLVCCRNPSSYFQKGGEDAARAPRWKRSQFRSSAAELEDAVWANCCCCWRPVCTGSPRCEQLGASHDRKLAQTHASTSTDVRACIAHSHRLTSRSGRIPDIARPPATPTDGGGSLSDDLRGRPPLELDACHVHLPVLPGAAAAAEVEVLGRSDARASATESQDATSSPHPLQLPELGSLCKRFRRSPDWDTCDSPGRSNAACRSAPRLAPERNWPNVPHQ